MTCLQWKGLRGRLKLRESFVFLAANEIEIDAKQDTSFSWQLSMNLIEVLIFRWKIVIKEVPEEILNPAYTI